jgi:hypothetical protein
MGERRVTIGERAGSALEPRRVEYDLGRNLHGAPLTLVRERAAGDTAAHWSLRRGAADQRDNSAEVVGLSDENLRAIGAALANHRPTGIPAGPVYRGQDEPAEGGRP